MIDIPQETSGSELSMITAMLQEARRNLIETVTERARYDLQIQHLDYTPDAKKVETIGTLLFHIAGVEWSWIFEDIDGEEFDYEKWKYAFALRKGVDVGQISGKPLNYYLEILEKTRNEVMERLGKMTNEDLPKIVESEGNRYTIRWILYHVLEHEIFHMGQIRYIIRSIRGKNL